MGFVSGEDLGDPHLLAEVRGKRGMTPSEKDQASFPMITNPSRDADINPFMTAELWRPHHLLIAQPSNTVALFPAYDMITGVSVKSQHMA
jgi:hypothetical protein